MHINEPTHNIEKQIIECILMNRQKITRMYINEPTNITRMYILECILMNRQIL